MKGDQIIIGEIKSLNEPPSSGSWRQKQPNDSDEFAKVRQDILDLERAGMLNPNVGGHGIIIRGQIPDYVSNLGKTYDLPARISGRTLKGGYSVPAEQAGNVVNALKNCGKRGYRVVENGGQAATFIFDL